MIIIIISVDLAFVTRRYFILRLKLFTLPCSVKLERNFA